MDPHQDLIDIETDLQQLMEIVPLTLLMEVTMGNHNYRGLPLVALLTVRILANI